VPRGLSEEAAANYRRFAAWALPLGMMTQADEPIIKSLAQVQEIKDRAYRELRESELTVETKDGVKKNPLIQTHRDYVTMELRIGVEYGMTASSRSKVHLEEGDQLSLADILFGEAAQRVSADVAPDDDV
jgi:P27 family predicted phage terminase small subunit